MTDYYVTRMHELSQMSREALEELVWELEVRLWEAPTRREFMAAVDEVCWACEDEHFPAIKDASAELDRLADRIPFKEEGS